MTNIIQRVDFTYLFGECEDFSTMEMTKENQTLLKKTVKGIIKSFDFLGFFKSDAIKNKDNK